MNHVQKSLLKIYLPLTLVILLLDHVFPGANFVNVIRYLTVLSLFTIAILLPKKYPEQKVLPLAVFFIVIGDFFLVFSNLIMKNPARVFPAGVFAFMLAYLVLIFIFSKNFHVGFGEVLVGLMVLAVAIPPFGQLYPFASGALKYGLIIFYLVLVYMAWTSLSTIFRGYFALHVAYRVALAGLLILICDIAVGISVLHPLFSNHFDPWLKNLIWGTYIPAWTLHLLNIAEEHL